MSDVHSAITTKTRLLTPGPTSVPDRVLQELGKPIIHHRTKSFRSIFRTLSRQLQEIFGTTGPVLSIAGSGTTAFEAAQVSLARPGSAVITVASGKFGERWQDVYDSYAMALRLNHIKINVPWGEPAPIDPIREALADHPDASVLTVVHSETSTATVSDVQAIADLTRRTDTLLIVDGVTSVGALPIRQDEWGIDVLVTGSQKALMLPPGLGYVGLGPRSLHRLEETSAGPLYNLDLRRWLKSWRQDDVPFTPPVSLIRAQKVACDIIVETGLEQVQVRTRKLAEGTRAAFASLGLELISRSPSDSVSGAFYPEGVDDSALRSALREKHGIHIAGGQDGRGASWKGKIFRISHMGHVDVEDTRAALTALEIELCSVTGRTLRSQSDTAVDVFNRKYSVYTNGS